MNGCGDIRELRERLVAARRRNDRAALPGLVDGLASLAGRGYRCCLVDFDACRPAYYVRVVGFEDARLTAELEFPIDPRVRAVQRLPLSHLVEYDEAVPSRIRSIYASMAPFLHDRRPRLAPAPTAARLDHDTHDRRPVRPAPGGPGATALWWTIAVLLFACSLLLLLLA